MFYFVLFYFNLIYFILSFAFDLGLYFCILFFYLFVRSYFNTTLSLFPSRHLAKTWRTYGMTKVTCEWQSTFSNISRSMVRDRTREGKGRREERRGKEEDKYLIISREPRGGSVQKQRASRQCQSHHPGTRKR